MLSNGVCLWSPFAVYSDRWLQMDRVYCSKGEEEEEDRGLERSQGDLEERVRAVCPTNAWGLGMRKLLFYSGNSSPHITSDTDQDPGPPASNVSSRIRCVSRFNSQLVP